MKFARLSALLLLLIPAAASARGGSQKVSPTAGVSFSDIRGHSINDYYGWNGYQMVSPNRAVYMGLNQPSRYANSTVAWTIQSGDNPLGSGNDRNEVLNMFGNSEQDEGPASGTQYYALSVYIPSTVNCTGQSSEFFIIAQLHGTSANVGHSQQAVFQFLLCSNLNTTNRYTLRTVGGPITGAGSIPAQDDVATDLGPWVTNQFEDFVFKVTWASDVEGNGHVTVYKRTAGSGPFGAAIADFATPTLYSSGGVTQPIFYWKRGIYRNSTSTQGTVTIYVSPFTRAPDMLDAATASFGSYP